MAEPRGKVSLRSRAAAGEGVVKYAPAYLLAAILLFIVVSPFVDRFRAATVFDEIVATLMLSCAIVAVGGRRRPRIVAIVIAIPAIGGQWLHQLSPRVFPWEIVLSASLLFVAFIIYCLFRFIFAAPRVDTDVLCAAVAGYLLLGILWAYAYSLEEHLLPGRS